ncbi:MAG: glycosyltransferase [Anaerostipes sp.]|nr:glycosyltransferase [Anaerostipes sp.]
MRKNIVLADTILPKKWELVEGIRSKTKEVWEVLCWDNAGLNKSKFTILKRYFGYFSHAFSVFLNRKKYKNIVSWQQFYGLIFAYYCILFRRRKENNLVIMTFIYNPKKGKIGKIYYNMVKKAIQSIYIDKIIVYSSSEVDYYSELFEVENYKFIFFPLGISDKKIVGDPKINLPEQPFVLSVGRSNRDYRFLLSCIKQVEYPVVILTDSIINRQDIPSNVIIYNNIRGDDYLRILSKAHLVAIALKDENISSGQLVMLQSMLYKKPIIITNNSTVKDYVVDGLNGKICNKNQTEFVDAISDFMNDDILYRSIVENGEKIFRQKYSLFSLGEKVSEIINLIME